MKRKLEDFGELSAAEKQILAEIDSGDFIELHDGLPPDVPGDYDVRAEFIRYLALGGCESCTLHEKGLLIVGGRVVGKLDLAGGALLGDLGLFSCRFDSELIFRSTKLQNLFLDGSFLPEGLSADRLEAKGGVFLRKVEVHRAVRLLGAKLGGPLDCIGAKFNAAKDESGELVGYAFSADGLESKGGFFLRAGAVINGEIRLEGIKVRALCDDLDCWPEGEKQLFLDRFHYDVILGGAPVDARQRLAWLEGIHHSNGFSPQPYEQLAKVLREMGHREDARVVLIEKERLQRKAQNPVWWRRVWNRVMRESAGYGYRPSLSLRYLAGLMLIGMLFFGGADLLGAVKPNSARVWHLDEWERCVDNPNSPKWCYLSSEKGKSYPAFNPIIYSVDTLLPIVDLEMQGAWIPDARASWWGIGARVYLWLHIALGWFFSLLAVAGFSGLIKPE